MITRRKLLSSAVTLAVVPVLPVLPMPKPEGVVDIDWSQSTVLDAQVQQDLTLDALKAISSVLRRNAIKPVIRDGEPYYLLDSETGRFLLPAESMA